MDRCLTEAPPLALEPARAALLSLPVFALHGDMPQGERCLPASALFLKPIPLCP